MTEARQLGLAETEQEKLAAVTLRRKPVQALALRLRGVLACVDGTDNSDVVVRQHQAEDRGQGDIAWFYTGPPLIAMVLCVDEKGQIQALDRTQRMLLLADLLDDALARPDSVVSSSVAFADVETEVLDRPSRRATFEILPRRLFRYMTTLAKLGAYWLARAIHHPAMRYMVHHPLRRYRH